MNQWQVTKYITNSKIPSLWKRNKQCLSSAICNVLSVPQGNKVVSFVTFLHQSFGHDFCAPVIETLPWVQPEDSAIAS